jgi:hypothetical protein
MASDRFKAAPPVVIVCDGPNYGLEYMQEREQRMLAALDAKALQHKAEQQAAVMRASNENVHDERTKQVALILFDQIIGEGQMVKVASKAVMDKYGISPRTLREWRKSR